MDSDDYAKRILNPAGGVVERIVPGYVGLESYWEHIERYRLASSILIDRGVVVDLACGSGYGSHFLARQGFRAVIGVDYSEDAVAHATACYSAHASNLSLVTGDASTVPLASGCADAFVSFETVEHLADPGRFLGEAARVLRTGGALVLSTPNRHLSTQRRCDNPFHISDVGIQDIVEQLRQNGLSVVQLYGQGVPTRNDVRSQHARLGLSMLEMVRRLLPSPVMNLLRERVLLPRRTGIPASVISLYRQEPHRFQNWIAANPIQTAYCPEALVMLDDGDPAVSHQVLILVARKGT